MHDFVDNAYTTHMHSHNALHGCLEPTHERGPGEQLAIQTLKGKRAPLNMMTMAE